MMGLMLVICNNFNPSDKVTSRDSKWTAPLGKRPFPVISLWRIFIMLAGKAGAGRDLSLIIDYEEENFKLSNALNIQLHLGDL